MAEKPSTLLCFGEISVLMNVKMIALEMFGDKVRFEFSSDELSIEFESVTKSDPIDLPDSDSKSDPIAYSESVTESNPIAYSESDSKFDPIEIARAKKESDSKSDSVGNTVATSGSPTRKSACFIVV